MKITNVAITACLVALMSIPSFAANSNDEVAAAKAQKDTQNKISLSRKGVVREVYKDGVLTDEFLAIKPIFIFKSKYEVGTETGYSRFRVRHARVGIQGDISKVFSYKFMVDLAAKGDSKILDLFVNINATDRLSFKIGQQGLSLFNPYVVAPNKADFVNRAFLGDYFISTRDLGLSAKYLLKKKGFPIAVEAGIYNGDGINNAKWTKSLAYGGRLSFGDMKGFRTTAKFYKSRLNDIENYIYWGVDARYENDDFKVEGEYMYKDNLDLEEAVDQLRPEPLSSAYVEGLAKIQLNSNVLKRFEPCVRWDCMGYEIANSGLGVNRATIGANLVFNTGLVNSQIRINYEHFFNNSKDLSNVFKSAMDNESKLSLEVLVCF